MDQRVFHLHAAKGIWPDGLGADQLGLEIVAPNPDNAMSRVGLLVASRRIFPAYDHFWLTADDNGSVVRHWTADDLRKMQGTGGPMRPPWPLQPPKGGAA